MYPGLVCDPSQGFLKWVTFPINKMRKFLHQPFMQRGKNNETLHTSAEMVETSRNYQRECNNFRQSECILNKSSPLDTVTVDEYQETWKEVG